MAEIPSPISGGLKIARRRMSSAVFTGKFVPQKAEQPQSDPIANGLIRANTTQVQRLSESVNGINAQMTAVDTTLRAVLQNLEANQALERQRESQEQNQNRILAQQKLLEGKENAIEKKIQSALVAPIAKIAPKVQFGLQSLMGFLTTVLGGWLIKQGLEAIKAASEGNLEKLEEIKNTVLKNLAIVGGIFLAINGGLALLVNTLTKLGLKILMWTAKGLFINLPLRIFEALKRGNKVKPGGGSAAPQVDAETKPPKPDKGKGKGSPQVDADGKPTAGGGKPKPPKTPWWKSRTFGTGIFNILLGTGSELLGGESPDRAVAGGLSGGIFSTATTGFLSKLPLPGYIKAPLLFGAGLTSYYYGSEAGKSVYTDQIKERMSGKSPVEDVKSVSPTSAADQSSGLGAPIENKQEVQSLSGLVDKEKFSLNNKNFFSEMDFKMEPTFGNVNLDTSSSDSPKEVSKAQITPPPPDKRNMVAQNLSSLKEPAPTIIPFPSVSDKKEKTVESTAGGGSSNTLPSIPSSIANMYTDTTRSILGVIA
jgi:hypothetical protein